MREYDMVFQKIASLRQEFLLWKDVHRFPICPTALSMAHNVDHFLIVAIYFADNEIRDDCA